MRVREALSSNHARVDVLPAMIAQSVRYFAFDARSGKSTASLLIVDGGVAAAFSR